MSSDPASKGCVLQNRKSVMAITEAGAILAYGHRIFSNLTEPL